MTIVSLAFFGFSLLVLALYHFLGLRAQNALLLVASYFFYLTLSPWFVLVLLALTAVDFGIGLKLGPKAPRRGLWLALGIGSNLAALVFFRQAGFFLPGLVKLLAPLGLRLDGLKIILPIGLSFYVLQAIAYLWDVARGRMPACRSLPDFALALAYFPKLTAGPIERLRDFIPRLGRPRMVDDAALARSVSLIVIGLARKIIVADTLFRAIPADLTTRPGAYSSLAVWLWLIAFIFALYNDFAGYTDVVRGLSGLFGIELSPNFARPLGARNLSEFWSRWHMTLTNWLKEYIYFPLSRGILRRSRGRWTVASFALPPVVTMIASGAWHGTGVNFLLWGALLGLVMVVESLPSLWRPVVSPERRPWPRRYLSTGLLWLVLLLSGVLFREALPVAVGVWKRMFAFTALPLPDSRVFLVILPALWFDGLQRRHGDDLDRVNWPLAARAAALAAAALGIFLFSQAQVGQPFIYQGF